ncbi:MAG: hypothetical protein J7J88_00380 [Dehalococcoidia bacterium]|nr:hypothetical protein [Dehalococcoidia bacterium]
MNITLVFNIGVLAANLALIYFVFRQVRHIYRPVITTKVVLREQGVDATPTVLVSRGPYLVVSNELTN